MIKQLAIQLLTLFTLCSFFYFFEVILFPSKDRGIKSRLLNFQIHIFNSIALILFALLLGNQIINNFPKVSLFDLIWPDWRGGGLLGVSFTIIIYAFVWDFFQYWAHRIQHIIPKLWFFHRVHHDERNMNSSTSLRQSLGSQLVSWILVHFPVLTLTGGYAMPLVGWFVLFNLWGCFNHANVKVALGPFTFLISGPQWHRLHHGIKRDYHDCNYAAFFPLIDILFGTFKLPKNYEWPKTGVSNLIPSKNPLREIFALVK